MVHPPDDNLTLPRQFLRMCRRGMRRPKGIFKRQGLRISRQTLDGWWLQTAEFLRPLYALAIRVALASHVLHSDDTSVKVRDAWQKRKYTGRFWPYVGDPRHALTVFDFTTSHQRDGPAAFLADYHGYLQADAFSGYDGIYLGSKGRIVEVGCWAHARRKFHESRRLDAARMETALMWIGKLYAVERDLRERCQGEWQTLTLEERAQRIAAARQERSRPLLQSFHAWLEPQGGSVRWSWDSVAHPDDVAHTLKKWQEARQNGSLFQNEIRVRRHDGQYRWFLVRAWPLRDASNRTVRWFGADTDYTI